MRILLDENVPVEVLPVLRQAGHEADSVNFIGWKGIQNGELIARAQQQYELLLTRDKDFEAEQVSRFITVRFGIGLLAIPQQSGPAYATIFARLWPTDASSLVGRASRLGD